MNEVLRQPRRVRRFHLARGGGGEVGVIEGKVMNGDGGLKIGEIVYLPPKWLYQKIIL